MSVSIIRSAGLQEMTKTDTPSMRERQARALIAEYRKIWPGEWPALPEAFRLVDATNAELQEPSEETLAAGDNALPPRHDDESLAIWQAMIQHIRGGGS
ncbi:MAG: hypothetical protein ACR2RE_00830 [Geminicoccaceae bacterium]